ncbi:hypothetical protein Btru_007881 [Bulinus truncatus]|nr:hypothetical protein Btru_007881 [Bulinus truncatus]
MTKNTENWVGQIIVQFHKATSCELGDRAEPMVLQHWSHSINSPVQQSGSYVHNQDCVWVIHITSATHVVLTFDRFELNDTKHGNFCDDYVTVNDSSGILFHSCEKFPEPFTIVTTTNLVDLIFHSDHVGTAAGFHVRYEGKCEGDVQSNSVLVTPNYPLAPPFPVTCRWRVGSENFKSIYIEIVDKAKLTDCKTAAVEVQSVTDRRTLSERLCVSRARMSVGRPVTLIYNYTDSDFWWGRIQINFSKLMDPAHCDDSCAFDSCEVKLLDEAFQYKCYCDRKSGSYKCSLQSQCVVDTCLKGEKNKMCPSGPREKPVLKWSSSQQSGLLSQQSGPLSQQSGPLSQQSGPLSQQSGPLSQRPVCAPGGEDLLSNLESVLSGNQERGTKETNLLTILISLADLSGKIGHQSFYVGDVLLLADMLETLTLYVENVTDIENGISVPCLQHFMHIVNDLVGENATNLLRQNKLMPTFRNSISRLAAQIISCTPTFTRNIIQKSFSNKTFPLKDIMLSHVDLRIFDLTIEGNIQTETFQILNFPKNLSYVSPITVQRNRLCVIEYKTIGQYFMMSDNLQPTPTYGKRPAQRKGNLVTCQEVELRHLNEPVDLMSSVLSVSLIDNSESEFNALNETIQLVYKSKDSLSNWNTTCGYLNLSLLSTEDRWITIGCVLVSQSSSEVRCDCDTLSDFGILGYPLEQVQLQRSEETIQIYLRRIVYIGCVITILACGAAFIMNYSLSSANIEVHLHEQLEVSLILFEISYILLWSVGDVYGLHNAVCYFLSALLQYTFIVVCFWLLFDAVQLYLKYQSPHPKCWLVYLSIAWGIPFVAVVSSLAAFNISYINVQLCWWNGQAFLSAILPVAVTLATLRAVFDVRNGMYVGKEGDEVKQIRQPEYFGGILIFITFSMGWTFAFIGLYLFKTSGFYLPVQTLFSIFNACTGVSVFLIHGLCNAEFVEKQISATQEPTGDGQSPGELGQLDVAHDVQDVGSIKQDVVETAPSRASVVTAPHRFSQVKAPARVSQESSQSRVSRVSTEQKDIGIVIETPSSTGEPFPVVKQSEGSIYEILRRKREPLIENIRSILADSQTAIRRSLGADQSTCWTVMPVGVLPWLLMINVARLSIGESCQEKKTVTDWSGTITSPGWSKQNYPDNLNCLWNIGIVSALKINLTLESLELGAPKVGSRCPDYLRIFTPEYVVFHGCKVAMSRVWSLPGNEIRIMFHSDKKGAGRGFIIHYIGECSGPVKSNRVLWTPNFPHPPPRNIKCFWEIGHLRSISTVQMMSSGEDESNLPACNISPVQITTKMSGHGMLCDSKLKKTLLGIFTVIYDTCLKPGWIGKLVVRIVQIRPSACSFTGSCQPLQLSDWTGSFSSVIPSSSLKYRNQTCTWVLHIKLASRIKITLNKLQLSGSYYGKNQTIICQDYLKISSDYQQLFHSCDLVLPGESLTFSFNKLLIEYHSQTSSRFSLSYKGECEQTIFQDTIITMPDFSELPFMDVTCTWHLGLLDMATFIQLHPLPESFDTDDYSSCKFSPVKILFDENKVRSMEEICASSWVRGYKRNVTLLYKYDLVKSYWTDLKVTFLYDLETFDCESVCGLSNCSVHSRVNSDSLHCLCTAQHNELFPFYESEFCVLGLYSNDTYYCPEDTDEYGIFWPKTEAVKTVYQSCPHDDNVNASRVCYFTDSQSDQAVWMPTNETICVSSDLTDMLHNLQMVNRLNESEVMSILDRTSALTTAINNTSLSSEMFVNISMTASEILMNLSSSFNELKLVDPKSFLKMFVDSVNNLIDEDLLQHFYREDTTMVKVDSMVNNVLDCTHKFVGTALTHNQEKHWSGSTELRLEMLNLDIKVKRWMKPEKFIDIGDWFHVQLSNKIKTRNDSFVCVGLFHTLSAFYSRLGTLNITQKKYIVVSKLVFLDVFEPVTHSLKHLNDPAVLTFRLSNSFINESSRVWCGHLNLATNVTHGKWLDLGCSMIKRNKTHVICSCNHLSNFAVLVDLYGIQQQVDEENREILSIVSFVGCSLSIIACASLISLKRSLRLKYDEMAVHEQLSISIIFVQTLYLLTIEVDTHLDPPQWRCLVSAVLIHYFLLVMFCWMLIEGVHLYIYLVLVYQVHSYFCYYIIFSWGFPLIPVAVTLGVFFEGYRHDQLCWISRKVMLYSLAPTLAVTVLVNIIVLVTVIWITISITPKHILTVPERNRVIKTIKASVILLPLLGFTWALNFLLIFVQRGSTLFHVINYTFAIMNSSQGCFIFLFHGLLNSLVQNALKRRFSASYRASLYGSGSNFSGFRPDLAIDHNLTALQKKTSTESTAI